MKRSIEDDIVEDDVEFWASLRDYRNYEISSYGRVFSHFTKRILKTNVNKGYSYLTLTNNEGVSKVVLVHRLVAICFIPNHGNKKTVNHINGLKHDNRLNNLEWSTSKEQMDHFYSQNKKHKKSNQACEIIQKDDKGNCVAVFMNMKDACNALRFSKSYLSCLIENRTCDWKGFYYEIYFGEKIDSEQWKQVEGYENYQVSNFGRLLLPNGKMVWGTEDLNGYFSFYLTKDKKTTKILAHRVVANTWIDNPFNLKTVGHLDNNPSNNHVNNLAWQSHKDQTQQVFKNGGGIKHLKPVVMTTVEGTPLNYFHSRSCAMKFTNIPEQQIFLCMKRNGTCCGYKWRDPTELEIASDINVTNCGCGCVLTIKEIFEAKKSTDL